MDLNVAACSSALEHQHEKSAYEKLRDENMARNAAEMAIIFGLPKTVDAIKY